MPARLLFLCVVVVVAVEARGEEREAFAPTDEPAGRAQEADNPCDGLGTPLAVDTEEHRLWLCKAGVADKSFKVSLGTGGVGKHTAGDSRTPIGTYPLGQPHPSMQYLIAIPVGYPTREQVKRGYTGKDIAIHGPLRLHRKANGRCSPRARPSADASPRRLPQVARSRSSATWWCKTAASPPAPAERDQARPPAMLP